MLGAHPLASSLDVGSHIALQTPAIRRFCIEPTDLIKDARHTASTVYRPRAQLLMTMHVHPITKNLRRPDLARDINSPMHRAYTSDRRSQLSPKVSNPPEAAHRVQYGAVMLKSLQSNVVP